MTTDTTSFRSESSAPDARVYAVILTFAAVLAVFIGRQIEAGAIPYLACQFKSLTSLPCPGCGITRSLAALAQFDLLHAFVLHPLGATLAVAASLSVPATWLDARFNQGRGTQVVSRSCGDWKFAWVLAALIAGNWIYLAIAGR